MLDRLFSAFWVPVLVIVATVALIVGVGELLLALAAVEEEIGVIREPYAVVGALMLALVVLIGATLISMSGNRS